MMRHVVFVALVAICAPLLPGQASAAQKGVPSSATPARAINGMSKLSESECNAAQGIVWEKAICASGQACAVQDENKQWRYVCLTKKQ